jgi:hypothetical protein
LLAFIHSHESNTGLRAVDRRHIAPSPLPPIGVSSYSVTPNVPSRLQGQLPSAGQIAALLAGID